MTVQFAGAMAPSQFLAVSDRLEAFCATAEFDRPTLVLDVDRVEAQYHALKAGLGHADIHYAVKANPHPAILKRLVQLGGERVGALASRDEDHARAQAPALIERHHVSDDGRSGSP